MFVLSALAVSVVTLILLWRTIRAAVGFWRSIPDQDDFGLPG